MSQGSTRPPYPQGHVLGISHFTGVVAGTEPCSDLHSFTASSPMAPQQNLGGVSQSGQHGRVSVPRACL